MHGETVKKTIVLFLPKTVLLAHLNNSSCNVTLDGLINISIWYLYLQSFMYAA